MGEKIIQNLRKNIEDPNHLVDSNVILAPRTPRRYRQPTHDARSAAVLIGLYKKDDDDDYFFSLIKRPTVQGDIHSGQVSLPGGRYEDQDEDYAACAMRETEEEIGVPRDKIQIIGQLSDLFVFASNYMVYPFVGIITEKVELIPEKREVERIIEVSMSHILNLKSIKYTDIKLSEGTLKRVPYYDIEDEIVWGATAMILSEFVYYWKASM